MFIVVASQQTEYTVIRFVTLDRTALANSNSTPLFSSHAAYDSGREVFTPVQRRIHNSCKTPLSTGVALAWWGNETG